MTITIRIPGSLANWFNGSDEIRCRGNTVKDCFDQIQEKHREFYGRILDEKGNIGSVLIFVNGENIRTLDGLATQVNDGDEIGIIPLAAGG
jgi:sulfur-carrier protein